MIQLSQQSFLLLIIIPLLVGLATNALWENFFRSMLSAIVRNTLRIGTLGISASINSVYGDIARKNTFKPIILILFLLSLASSVSFGWHSEQYYRVTNQNLKNTIETRSTVDFNKKIHELELKIQQNEVKIAQLDLILSITLMMYLIFNYARSVYIINAILHFEQCISILEKCSTEEQKKIFISEFASISNKKDYLALLEKIWSYSENNQITIPKFKAF